MADSNGYNAAPDEQPVYQGGAFTNITDLAGKLGAQHDRNLDNGRITVNGRNIPWTSAIGGQYHGSVQDVAQAAGGRVERGANGSYQVYAPKATPTPDNTVPVTGNPQISPPRFMPTPGDHLRRLMPGIGWPTAPQPAPGMPGHPPITMPVQPPGQMQAMGAQADSPPVTGNPLRNLVPGIGGRAAVPGMPGRPPVTLPVEPPRMSIMGAGAQTDAASTTPPGWQREPQGPTPAAQALGQQVTAQSQPAQAQQAAQPQYTLAQLLAFGLTPEQAQQYLNDPKNATNAANPNDLPPGFEYTPGPPTPAAIDLGNQTMGADNQLQAPATATDTATQQSVAGASPDAGGYGPPQYQLPQFNYQDQQIDYGSLMDRAQAEAKMWADPYLQQLRDAAAMAQQRYGNQAGYVNRDLSASIGDLRGGEAAREQRINEDMNRRGDAIYNSGIRYAGLAQQQAATVAQESKLTTKAQNALTKLSDSLGLTLQDITSKTGQLARQQGEKAYLTLQQLADKAQTQQFENRKLAWQMWQQGATLTLDQQKMANELWMHNQRMKVEDDRAAADRALKLAIANGQLEQKYAQMYGTFAQKQTELMGYDAQGNPTFAAQKFSQEQADKMVQAAGYVRAADGSLVRSLDGQKFDLSAAESMSKQLGYVIGVDGRPLLDDGGQPVRTLEGAKFDWDKQKFTISEGNKVAYQNELISLRQQGLITQQQHNAATEEIQRGSLSIRNAQLIESNRHNQAMETKPSGTTANTAWKGAYADVNSLVKDYSNRTQFGGASPTLRTQYAGQMATLVTRAYQAGGLTDSDKTALVNYLKSAGWWDEVQAHVKQQQGGG